MPTLRGQSGRSWSRLTFFLLFLTVKKIWKNSERIKVTKILVNLYFNTIGPWIQIFKRIIYSKSKNLLGRNSREKLDNLTVAIDLYKLWEKNMRHSLAN